MVVICDDITLYDMMRYVVLFSMFVLFLLFLLLFSVWNFIFLIKIVLLLLLYYTILCYPCIRAGNTLTDAHVAQLFQNKSPPLPPPHKNASSSSLDSSGSGDEWTHVSVSDIAGSGVETATVTEAVTGSLPPIEVQMEDMLTPETQDALMQEVMLLKGFFLSQAAGAGTGAGVAKAGSISVSVSVSTSPEMKQQQQPQQQGLGTGGEECTYSPASPSFLLSSASVLQVVLEVFSSDEVLNMRALENNPTYLSR